MGCPTFPSIFRCDFTHALHGRSPAPPGMYKTLGTNDIFTISAGDFFHQQYFWGFKPSFFHVFFWCPRGTSIVPNFALWIGSPQVTMTSGNRKRNQVHWRVVFLGGECMGRKNVFLGGECMGRKNKMETTNPNVHTFK